MSFDPQVPDAHRGVRVARAEQIIRELTGVHPDRMAGRSEVVLAANLDDVGCVVDQPPGSGCIFLTRGCRTESGTRIKPREFLDSAAWDRSATSDARVAAPFGACFWSPVSRGTGLITDHVGLQHLFWWQGGDWAAASSSGLLLARLCGEGLDEGAIGTYALAGSYFFGETPFRNVRRVSAATICWLAHGRVSLEASAGPDRDSPSEVSEGPGGGSAVDSGVTAVRTAVNGCLQAYGQPTIELSGGFDSRMILAAIPAAARRGLPSHTIGVPGSPDWEIAGVLARRYGLDHRYVDLRELEALTPGEAADLVSASSRRHEHSGNPLALAVLDWVESRFDQGPRLTGQNGEFGRGFYYSGQPSWSPVSVRLIRRLARWRIFTNDRVSDSIVDPEFLAEARRRTLTKLEDTFLSIGGGWMSATDEFYLRERMQGWLGVAYSAAAASRPILAPWFSRSYLDWCRESDPRDKRGSGLFARVLAELDPNLAAVPLSQGTNVTATAYPNMVDRGRKAVAVADKLSHKGLQRVLRKEKPAVGAARLAELVRGNWEGAGARPAGIERLGFLRRGLMDDLASGSRSLNSASLGFLVNLEGAVRFLDHGRTPSRSFG